MCAHVHICSIAIVYKKQGKYPEALELYHKSLATKEKVLGCEHPSAADTLYNIALLHQEQGQHDIEAECFDKCVVIYAAVYGDAHNKTADARTQATCAHAAMVPN